MGDSTHGGEYHRGHMDISEHKQTFSAFLKITEWGTVLIVASVAMFTVAFAMGFGWFPGLIAFVALCAAAGFLMKMGAAWWATTIALTVLMAIGGAVTALGLSFAG
jgi:hypothetical protein